MAVAAGLRWALWPFLGSDVPLLLFVLPVAASAWVGGLGPGLLATAASLLAAHLVSAPHRELFLLSPTGYISRLILFALVGLTVSLANDLRRRAVSRTAEAAAEADREARARREGEERFRRIVETAREGIWQVDAAGRTTYVNGRMAEMLGYEPEEMVGRSAFEFVPEEDRADAERAWRERRMGAAGSADFAYRHRDGRILWMRVAAAPVVEEGRFEGAIGLFTDVTEAREGEEALRAGESRKATHLAVTGVLATAESVADAVPRILQETATGLGWDCGAMWTVDPVANVLRCTAVWCDAGRRLDEFEAATRRVTFSPGVGLPGRVWTSGEGAWIVDVGADTNFPRQAEARAAGLRSAFAFPVSSGREALGVVEFFSGEERSPDPELLEHFQNVGSQVAQFVQRKRVEEERVLLLESEQAARRDAEAANRAKDEFLSTLSHELRTPLNAIVGWAHLLRTGQLDETQARRAVEVIDRNAKAQSQIVADVLDVSRVVMGKLRIESQPVELPAVAAQALESVRPAAAAKDIRLREEIDAAGTRVTGDPDRLQQVVWNLLTNGIKFTPPGGEVRLTVRGGNRHAEIRVEDTGSGIAPEFLPHVFERFRQSDSSTTRAHGGLGLGLALVRHLVEMHGGTVSASSAGPGQGSSFVVRLPALAAAAGGGRISAGTAAAGGGRGEGGPEAGPRPEG